MLTAVLAGGARTLSPNQMEGGGRAPSKGSAPGPAVLLWLHPHRCCYCTPGCCHTWSPDPGEYSESHPWRMVAQDLMAQYKQPEHLGPAPPLRPKEGSRPRSQSSALGPSWMLLSAWRTYSQRCCFYASSGAASAGDWDAPGHPGGESSHLHVQPQGTPTADL